MARAIVRFSIQKNQKPLRGQVLRALRGAGFRRIGTSSFESSDVPLPDLAPALTELVERLATGRLDHLWIYVDVPGIETDDDESEPN